MAGRASARLRTSITARTRGSTWSSKYEFDLDGELLRAERGDFVHAPRGGRHSYRNVGEAAGQLLTLYAPGGLEGLFLEVGEPVSDPAERPKGPADPGRLLERAPAYGLEFLVPDAGPGAQ